MGLGGRDDNGEEAAVVLGGFSFSGDDGAKSLGEMDRPRKCPRSMAAETRASTEEEREGMVWIGVVVTLEIVTSFLFNHFLAPSLLGLRS